MLQGIMLFFRGKFVRKIYGPSKPSRDFKGAVRAALKKAKHRAHEGVRHGGITVDAPSSSAMGQLARMAA